MVPRSSVTLACAAAVLVCSAACVSEIAIEPPAVVDPPVAGFVPAEARLRRLLAFQVKNAVADIFGAPAAALVDPPADVPINGFASVGSATLAMSPLDVEKLETSAFAAAAEAVHGATPQSFRVCEPTGFDDAECATRIVSAVGRRVFRRALTADELERWSGIASQAAGAYGDFDMGLEYAFAGLLQSPSFIYLVEVGAPLVPGDEGVRRLTGVELASRLSFFLVGTTPSDELLDAAEAGELDTREGVRLHAERLLESPRAKLAMRAFFAEKLGLAALATVNRDELSDAVRAAMQEETLRFVDDVVWDRNADARELFTSDTTFVNDELAAFYGLPLPGQGAEFSKVTLAPSSRRAGLFTQGAFLVRFAHEGRSSPTLRGKFIRENVMCQAVSAPPDDVSTVLPDPDGETGPQTTRERMNAHVAEPRCAGCHLSMDPIGFAYEEFDQVGRLRSEENGLPVDATTDLDGVPVTSPREMGQALADYPSVLGCLMRGLFRHGVGHVEEEGEDPSLFLVEAAFEDAGFRLQDALVEIAVSDAFRHVQLPTGAPAGDE